jgi:[citrate (pro-3S)-lyase] ligase
MSEYEQQILSLMAAIAGFRGDLFEFFKGLGHRAVSIYAETPLGLQIWMLGYTSGFHIHKTVSDVERTFKEYPLMVAGVLFEPYNKVTDYGNIPVLMVNVNGKILEVLKAQGIKVYFLKDILLYEYFRVGLCKKLTALKNDGVSVLLFNQVSLGLLKKYTIHEKWLMDHWGRDPVTDDYREQYAAILNNTYYCYGFTEEYVQNCASANLNMLERVGSTVRPRALNSLYNNSSEGFRLTTDIPDNPTRYVFCLGNSVVRGYGVDDSNTIPSALQRYINRYAKTSFAVFNAANTRHSDLTHIATRLDELKPEAGDIVIIGSGFENIFVMTHLERLGFLTCHMTPRFEHHDDLGEVFSDPVHMNAIGYREYARAIYFVLRDSGSLDLKPVLPSFRQSITANSVLSTDTDAVLSEYLDKLREVKVSTGGEIGAIIMNCNPFTFGHQYLIEYASQRMSHLYIFVVEEDLSEFPFADRLMLVKQGVEHLPNVTVIPSGQFIISRFTFKEYFVKESSQDTIIDASQDISLFANSIVPILGITTRFVGEEPTDAITRQYNVAMKALLPKQGVKLVEIPRKMEGGGAISASQVRKLLKLKDLDAIAKLVPQTTLEYLKRRSFDARDSSTPQ